MSNFSFKCFLPKYFLWKFIRDRNLLFQFQKFFVFYMKTFRKKNGFIHSTGFLFSSFLSPSRYFHANNNNNKTECCSGLLNVCSTHFEGLDWTDFYYPSTKWSVLFFRIVWINLCTWKLTENFLCLRNRQ